MQKKLDGKIVLLKLNDVKLGTTPEDVLLGVERYIKETIKSWIISGFTEQEILDMYRQKLLVGMPTEYDNPHDINLVNNKKGKENEQRTQSQHGWNPCS